MPTAARPALRIHQPGGRDEAPWPPRADPRRPPAGDGDGLRWLRYGRLPHGAAPGCFLDVVIHEGRPPAGMDAGFDPVTGRWYTVRVVDPADALGGAG
ncbi:hypothetical protein [Paludisphaera sp.]|uniref:hypothetical protein n=1 Tax=Paludisphaera sp. TaxID=2017432 RepID=UPI00301DDB93